MGRLVLSTMSFDEPWLRDIAAVSEEVEVVQVPTDRVDELPEDLLGRAEVLYTSSALPDPASARALRWVQLDTAGADHLGGTPLWAAPQVAITSIGGVSERPVAEYVMAMVLAHAHRLPEVLADRAGRRWPTAAERWERYGPRPVLGARMCVVGYGKLGRAVARAARSFDMEVVGVRRGGVRAYTQDAPGVEVVTAERLAQALTGADHVVVCVPGTPETRGLIGAPQLALVAPGAALVDVSRGGVVDEPALLAALEGPGPLAWAARDVFASEPLAAASPFWEHPAVWPTPHVSGLAPHYADGVRTIFKANLERYLSGRPLLNEIDRTLGY